MELGEKLRDLDLTADETSRLAKALQDDKFREMLRGFAQELADPDNKKKYEEEMTLLEQERGNNVEFIHPEPFRVLRTSVDGKRRCYVNICGNDKVGKPECKSGTNEEGRRGQCWSLPHSLHPGRPDLGAKGDNIMIYDVIFHPDTLHIATKNARFMDMVDSTALQGIQDAFKVSLDKKNARRVNTKYKGTPQPCVIRKPIPGFQVKDPPEHPLAFPNPQPKRTQPPAAKASSGAKPKSFQITPRKTDEPTRPSYTIKYRSFVDMQDFTCSRDAVKNGRPKEMVVTIDVPLLKSVADTDLEVKERSLLLESKRPTYRLELPLSYPVDQEKGEAKFNKQRGQLIITLPVLPSRDDLEFAAQAVSGVQSVGDEKQREKEEEEDWEEQERDSSKSESGVDGKVEEDEEWRNQERKREKGEDAGAEAEWEKQKRAGQEREEGGEAERQKSDRMDESGEGEERREQERVSEKSESGVEEEVVEEKLRNQERKREKREEDADAELKPEWQKQACQKLEEEEGGAKGQKGDRMYESREEDDDEEKKEWEEQRCEIEDQTARVNTEAKSGELNNECEEESKHSIGFNERELVEEPQETDTGSSRQASIQHAGLSAEEENSAAGEPITVASTEKQPLVATAEPSTDVEAGDEALDPLLDSTPQVESSNKEDKIEMTEGTVHANVEVEAEAALLNQTSQEESQTTAAAPSPASLSSVEGGGRMSGDTGEPSEAPATSDEASRAGGTSGDPGEHNPGVANDERTDVDGDAPPAEHIVQQPESDKKPPAAILREVDSDGNESVVCDHSTSAGFSFHNSLLYELD